MYTSGLGISFQPSPGFRPPAAPPPRQVFHPHTPPPAIRFANRSSTRPIIRSPGAYQPSSYRPGYRPGFEDRYARYEADAAARAAANAQMIALQTQQQYQQQMLQPQQVQSSPAAPGGDLTPAQDNSAAADAASAATDPVANPHNKHLLLFAGLAVAAGVGGYVILKKRKSRA